MKKNMFGINKDGFKRLAQDRNKLEVVIYPQTIQSTILDDGLSEDEVVIVSDNIDDYTDYLTTTLNEDPNIEVKVSEGTGATGIYAKRLWSGDQVPEEDLPEMLSFWRWEYMTRGSRGLY